MLLQDSVCFLCHSTVVKSVSKISFRKAQEEKKKVVLAGCVPQAQPRQDYLNGLSIIGVSVFQFMLHSRCLILKSLSTLSQKNGKGCVIAARTALDAVTTYTCGGAPLRALRVVKREGREDGESSSL